MKTVKIVNGTYGHKPAGAKRITPISLGETVDLSDAEAERLVALNVAAYVQSDGETVTTAVPDVDVEHDTMPDSESVAEDNEEIVSDEEADSSYLDAEHLKKTMKLEELKQLANDLGIDTNGLDTKAKLADAISQVPVTHEDDESETPPILTTEDPV